MLSYSEAANSGAFITLTDKNKKEHRFQVGAIGPEDLALAREKLRERTKDPIQIAKENLEGLSPEDRKFLLEKGFDEYQKWGDLTTPIGRAWVGSAEGLAFFIWRGAIRNHPDLTYETVFALVNDMAVSGLAEALNKAAKTMDRVSHPPAVPAPRIRRNQKGRRKAAKKT